MFNHAIAYYARQIGYKYDAINNYGIHINVNSNDKFGGCCVSWTLLFQSILSNAPPSFEITTFCEKITKIEQSILNHLIEIFSVYVYSNFCKKTTII